MHNVVLLGPQGCGKGTQGEIIAERLKIPLVSVGRLFRAEMGRATGLGRDISAIIERGELVPSDITKLVVMDRLSEPDATLGVIVDGYPRSVEQAGHLDDIFHFLNRKLTHVIYIELSDDEAVRRLSGRRICSNPKCERGYHLEFLKPKVEGKCDVCGNELVQRRDDHAEAITKRLEIFHQENAPILDYYEHQGILHRVDGNQPIEALAQVIAAQLGA